MIEINKSEELIDKMLERGFVELDEEEVEGFGDPVEYCEGNGNCSLFEHQVTGEVECTTCGAQFYAGSSDDDEEENPVYFDFDDDPLFQKDTLSVYEEVELERKQEIEEANSKLESKIDDVDFKLGVIIEFLNENVTVEENSSSEKIKKNIFLPSTKHHDIMEMLLDGPQTLEDIHKYLPKVKGKKMSVENLGKFIEKEMNMYELFTIEKTFDGRYKIGERK